MKKCCFIVLMMMPFFVSVLWAAGEPVKQPFIVGEKLKFEIGWEVLKAGFATLEVVGLENNKDRKCYHLKATVETSSMFNSIFKVGDVYESWMDLKNMYSIKFLTSISEGSYKRKETLLFNHKNNTYVITESKKTGKIDPAVQDVISALYSIRTKTISVGRSYPVEVQMGDTSWPIAVRVLYKEKVTVPAGTFDCFVVMPMLRNKKAVSSNVQGTLIIWLTADEKKIPVKISCKIPMGAITADLVELKK